MAKFSVDTDKQIARALLQQGSDTRRGILARANIVGIHYRRLAREELTAHGQGSQESPFLAKDQVSITDKSAFSVDARNGQIILSVNAPAAEFAEVGNGPGDITSDDPMAIRIKPSKVRRGRGKRGGRTLTLDSGTKVRKYQGKFYIFTPRIKSFSGYHLLERAVRIGFRL